MEKDFKRLLEIYSSQLGFKLDKYHIDLMRNTLETYDLFVKVEKHLK
jgi:hypothetical protein